MEELIGKLQELCEVNNIQRFSPEEMTELLEEGETVDWIIEQVLPEDPNQIAQELTILLGEVAAQVAPPPSTEEEEGDKEGEDATEDATPESMELALQQLKDIDLPPGVDRAQLQQLMNSPRGALLADFGTFCEEKGVNPEIGQGEMSEAVQTLHEEWLDTPRETLEGKKPSEMLDGGRLFPQKVETFRREAPKVGRNDSCPCGSGKKYKKCCGKSH